MNIVSPDVFAALFALTFIAGFVDAIAGGGGLITVPALALAGLDPVVAIATSKLQACFGSGAATLTFWRAGHIQWRAVWPLMLAAALGSIIGASFLTKLPADLVLSALPPVLTAVALYFAFSPRLRQADAPPRVSPVLFTCAFVPLVGAYDGIFGPGTGSFYMIGFVALSGCGILRATARTKAANFASNIAGLATLSLGGHIVWTLGLAMGVAQMLGAWLGARSAIGAGARLIKPLVIVVCILLAGRLALDSNGPWREILREIGFSFVAR